MFYNLLKKKTFEIFVISAFFSHKKHVHKFRLWIWRNVTIS